VSSYSQEVRLRDVHQDDVAIFFEHQREPEANYMIALSTKKPHDEISFQEQWQRILHSETMLPRTIEANGLVAGYVASFYRLGKLEVSYWLGSYFWGRGLATASLFQFFTIQQARPIYARAAKKNRASCRVL
jgi:RimJ/RimL family protein N-acetyltransferase